jgi:hypothetical protein
VNIPKDVISIQKGRKVANSSNTLIFRNHLKDKASQMIDDGLRPATSKPNSPRSKINE